MMEIDENTTTTKKMIKKIYKLSLTSKELRFIFADIFWCVSNQFGHAMEASISCDV